VPKVLIVSNDFPPRRGGIQSFVHALASRMPAGSVVVYAPSWDGAAEFDARQPFPVIRHPTSLMLPVPTVGRRAARILREHGCDTVLFGAAAPLGLLAPSLRRAGARRLVAITHGHEAGWAALPGARALLHRIGDRVDVLTYLGEYFRVRLARALSAEAAARMVRLAPGVDNGAFRPGASGNGIVGGNEIRERLGLGDRPVVVCVSRMVPRKGQDTLIRAWPQVLAASVGEKETRRPALKGRAEVGETGGAGPAGDGRAEVGETGSAGLAGDGRAEVGETGGAGPAGDGRAEVGETGSAGRAGEGRAEAGETGSAGPAGEGLAEMLGRRADAAAGPVLLLVGDGPYRAELERLAQRTGVSQSVVFTGAVPPAELPAHYAAGNVFAMPCRTRRGGLDVEGLGIVYLEASASGLPVVGGDSGGAPDAILDGETGYVVPGRDVGAVARRISELLADPAGAAAMGEKGAAWVDREWRWDLVAERLWQVLSA
jgi:glycosyltransferase involved in cell wall biosynthesis